MNYTFEKTSRATVGGNQLPGSHTRAGQRDSQNQYPDYPNNSRSYQEDHEQNHLHSCPPPVFGAVHSLGPTFKFSQITNALRDVFTLLFVFLFLCSVAASIPLALFMLFFASF